jgi:hypothetical protein
MAQRQSATSRAVEWPGFAPDPHVDYSRTLTEAGGILIHFKDFDLRLRHILWGLLAWSIATGSETWYLLHHSPLHRQWLTFACLATAALANLLIVAKPVEIYRSIEIRPDCMIIGGCEVFWLRLMEAGLPAFYPDEEGNQILCGIYGTRLVQYLSIPRFDELDRAPEVLAAHLQEAMSQLWARPF